MLHRPGSSGAETELRPVDRPGELGAPWSCVAATVGGLGEAQSSAPPACQPPEKAETSLRAAAAAMSCQAASKETCRASMELLSLFSGVNVEPIGHWFHQTYLRYCFYTVGILQ